MLTPHDTKFEYYGSSPLNMYYMYHDNLVNLTTMLDTGWCNQKTETEIRTSLQIQISRSILELCSPGNASANTALT